MPLFAYFIREMNGEQIGLLSPCHLDLERDPDRDAHGHGGTQGAVRCDLAFHSVLDQSTERSKPELAAAEKKERLKWDDELAVRATEPLYSSVKKCGLPNR